MRAPGKASARPGLPGLRVAMAASVPVREWATPPAKALAMLPGPRMPQRTGEDAEFMKISLDEAGQARGRAAAADANRSAQPEAGAVEQVGMGRPQRDRHLVEACLVPRFLALDDKLLAAAGIGVDVAGRPQMLGNVDLDGDIAVAAAG